MARNRTQTNKWHKEICVCVCVCQTMIVIYTMAYTRIVSVCVS